MRNPALIHSLTSWLSRGVSMPRIDQRALHLGSCIIAPWSVQSRRLLASSQQHPRPSVPCLGGTQLQPKHTPTRIKSNSPDVAYCTSRRTFLLACSTSTIILPSHHRWSKTPGGWLDKSHLLLPSSQFRPPLRPRGRYTAAPLELLHQDQKAHSLIRVSIPGPVFRVPDQPKASR